MGNCFDDQSIKYKNKKQKFGANLKLINKTNPIVNVLKQWNVQNISKIWLDNQNYIIQQKLQGINNQINFIKFQQLLPNLKNLSNQIQQNIFNLFCLQGEKIMKKEEFIIAQLLLLKSDDYQILSDSFFYIYSYSNDQGKQIMNDKQYHLFRKEMKDYQLQFLNDTKNPKKSDTGQIKINKIQFRQIFQQHDIKQIKRLFEFNLKKQEQQFANKLQQRGINRKNGEQVYLIDFKWFIKWKAYIQYKYGVQITIKQNDKQLDREKKQMINAFVKSNDQIILNSKFLAKQTDKTMERINNNRIKGEQQNQLKENQTQYEDFISISKVMWRYLRLLYGGGPSIIKIYPNFYTKKIMLAVIHPQKIRFGYGNITKVNYEQEWNFEKIFLKHQIPFSKDQINDVYVYYKYPGKLEWTRIQNLQSLISDHPFQYKTFIVFVKKNIAKKFQSKFNIKEIKEQIIIEQPIRNLGSIVNFQNDGVLEQGHIGNIFKNFVIIYYKNEKGQYQKFQKLIKSLEKDNPKVISQNNFQGLAGLQNLSNTCYISASLQCLLRTPYFGDFLQSFNFGKDKRNLLTYQLYNIYNQTKLSRDCIYMKQFKKKLDQVCPYFQGNAQHDAQQFLILLLDKLSQQKISSKINIQSTQNSLFVNKDKNKQKIMNFFSGQSQSVTSCLKCKNQSKSSQSFFTYSLPLPKIDQILFTLIYIDQNFKSYKYGFNVRKQLEFGDVLLKVSYQLKIKKQQLLVMSIFQNQWYQNIGQKYKQRDINSFDNYQLTLACYKISTKQDPNYQDFRVSRKITSVKVQVRNRIYDGKSRSFKSFFLPFCIEITEQTTTKSLKQQILKKMSKFIDQDQLFKYQKALQQKSNQQSQKKITLPESESKSIFISFLDLKNSQQTTPGRKQDQLQPFVIRFVRLQKNMQSVCWFCRKQINISPKKSKEEKYCNNQCGFQNDQKLYQIKIFRKYWENLKIMIDWRSQAFVKNMKVQETSNYEMAIKKVNQQKSNIQVLLKQSENQEQNIQLKCQKQQCKHYEAVRKQRIKTCPNILILHLKRFQFRNNKFMKMRNKIKIPEQFFIPRAQQKYQLYGNVVHFGSGRGGHYISYVKVKQRWFKCDDQKVHQIKNQNKQYLNENTYLLFYKKKNLEKGLKVIGF